MPNIPSEVVNKASSMQNAVWQTVSLTVSEAANLPLNFGSPLTIATSTTDLYAEMAAPKMVVQFSFANMPENSQVVLISQETVLELASAVRGDDVKDIDENTLSELRPAIEAIVQGICLAVGNTKNEAMVASGLSVRFQIFSFPPNMQKSEELLRTNVALAGDGLNGAATWLVDVETAHFLVGVPIQEELTTPFAQMSGGPTANGGQGSSAFDEANSLELLMDIPLEISVELGRVRMLVKEVVDLGSGSIVEIDKAAGEPVDVLVNGRLVARGEVVVIEDNFGVRITEILTPQERLNKLNEAA